MVKKTFGLLHRRLSWLIHPFESPRRGQDRTMNYRFTFQFAEGKALFRRIGTHDIHRMEG